MAPVPPYTEDPAAGSYVVFPTHAHQILSNCISIIGVSVLSYCFARQTEHERLHTRQGWANVSWTRLCVMLLFLDSWFFLAFTGVLVNGVGLSTSVTICSLGIYACIFFYAGSKVLIYTFLMERVWIVWSAGNSLTRRQSVIYKICALIVLGYIGIFIVMFMGRISSIRDDGTCVIGLQKFSSIPLLSYDLFINVFLTSMFIWPLYRENLSNPNLKRVAWKTMFAAFAALTTSTVNIFILTILHGKELGWVCLASCSADVTMNALVLFWVTSSRHRDGFRGNNCSLPPIHVPVSFVRDPNVLTKAPTPPPPQLGNTRHSPNNRPLSSTPDFNSFCDEDNIDSAMSVSAEGSRDLCRNEWHHYEADCVTRTPERQVDPLERSVSVARLSITTSHAPPVTQPPPAMTSLSSLPHSVQTSRRTSSDRRSARILRAFGEALTSPWRPTPSRETRSTPIQVTIATTVTTVDKDQASELEESYEDEEEEEEYPRRTRLPDNEPPDPDPRPPYMDCQRIPINDVERMKVDHSSSSARTRPHP